MSFLTLGIFWAGQQTQLNHIGEGTRDLTWIHLGFLFTITLLPLSTRLLAEFITYRGALGIYWLNISAARRDALLELGSRHALRPHQARHTGRSARQHLQANPHRAVALRRRRGALLHQHLCQHRGHRAGAVELRHRAKIVG